MDRRRLRRLSNRPGCVNNGGVKRESPRGRDPWAFRMGCNSDGFMLPVPWATDNVRRPHFNQAAERPDDDFTPDWLLEVITKTLPEDDSQRGRKLFELARELKAVVHLAEAEAADLLPIVERWHRAAIVGPGLEDDQTAFLAAWPKVKFPAGTGPLDRILDIARRSNPPPETLKYGNKFQLLASLCRELQRHARAEPFFLSCRTAGKLLGVDHVTAWRYFLLLQANRTLQMIEKGTKARRRATSWRYTGSDLSSKAA